MRFNASTFCARSISDSFLRFSSESRNVRIIPAISLSPSTMGSQDRDNSWILPDLDRIFTSSRVFTGEAALTIDFIDSMSDVSTLLSGMSKISLIAFPIASPCEKPVIRAAGAFIITTFIAGSAVITPSSIPAELLYRNESPCRASQLRASVRSVRYRKGDDGGESLSFSGRPFSGQ